MGRGKFARLRAEILLMDNKTCQACGSKESIVVHHVNPVSNGGVDELCNLLAVCMRCEKAIHADELRMPSGPRSSKAAIFNVALLRELAAIPHGRWSQPRDRYLSRRSKPRGDASPTGRWVGLRYDRYIEHEGSPEKMIWTDDAYITFSRRLPKSAAGRWRWR